MRNRFGLFFLSIPIFTLWFCTSPSGAKDKDTTNFASAHANENSIVVLELFTSQGCSSCPAADRLLATFGDQKNIIPLSFHVDYWDRLGWKDPYSSHQYTERQYKYASALHSQVYTPQLVINGESEMVGSDANKIKKMLQKLFSQDSKATITIENVKFENGKAEITYLITGALPGTVLNIALVEKKTSTPIRAGENNGATLSGTNVVRNFKSVSAIHEGNGFAEIPIPAGFEPGDFSVVLYLQSGDSKIVSGAIHKLL